MNIGEVVKGIFLYLFNDATEHLIKPLLEAMEMIALSPETLDKISFVENTYSAIQGIGAAILIIITSWQLIKSMGIGIGLQGDEPQKIGVKAFIAAFLLYWIKDIMIYFVALGSGMINLILEAAPQSTNSGGAFQIISGLITDNMTWLYIIFLLVLAFKSVGLFFRMFERLMLCAVMIAVSPLAVAAMASKNTEGFWQGFLKLFIGNIVIQIIQAICFVAMLASLSLISTKNDDLSNNVFFFMVSISIVSITNKLEDIVRDISMSVGIGRDMQGAFSKMQGAFYAISQISYMRR